MKRAGADSGPRQRGQAERSNHAEQISDSHTDSHCRTHRHLLLPFITDCFMSKDIEHRHHTAVVRLNRGYMLHVCHIPAQRLAALLLPVCLCVLRGDESWTNRLHDKLCPVTACCVAGHRSASTLPRLTGRRLRSHRHRPSLTTRFKSQIFRQIPEIFKIKAS